MREFFHGWRRKAGCVLLLVACAMTGMWIRSFYVYDVVRIHFRGQNYRFKSVYGNVAFKSYSFDFGEDDQTSEVWSKPFDSGKEQFIAASGDGISLLSLAIPLTLLSAYLILWKPRKASAKTSSVVDGA